MAGRPRFASLTGQQSAVELAQCTNGVLAWDLLPLPRTTASYPAGTVSSSRHLRALPVSHLLLPLSLVCSLSKEEAFRLFKLLMLPSSRLLPFRHPSSVLLAQRESPELILPVSPAREAAELLRAVLSPGALLSSSRPLIPCLPQHCSWERKGQPSFIGKLCGSLQAEIHWSSSDSSHSAKICPSVMLIT